MIPLSVPHIFDSEKNYVQDCLETGWVSSAGKYVDAFEESIRSFTGIEHSCAVMNGTSGLHLALTALGITHNDCVLTNNLTFVATLNSISYTGAEPILVDVKPDTWQIDLELLENWLKINTIKYKDKTVLIDSKKVIKAIVPVYVMGNAYDVFGLQRIAKEYNLKIIEDSTEALGTKINSTHAGNFGDIGVFSFNGNKIITTGGGGMIVSKNKSLISTIRHLSTTAKTDPLNYFHDEIGYNYRLVNVLAAIGLGQMENIQAILNKKQMIFKNYKENLSPLHINFQATDKNVDWNHWMVSIKTKESEKLREYLDKKDIQTRPFWTPMNELPMFKDLTYISLNNVSKELFNSCTSIPCSFDLTSEEQWIIIESINTFFNDVIK